MTGSDEDLLSDVRHVHESWRDGLLPLSVWEQGFVASLRKKWNAGDRRLSALQRAKLAPIVARWRRVALARDDTVEGVALGQPDLFEE